MKHVLLLALMVCGSAQMFGQQFVFSKPSTGDFPLATKTEATSIYVDPAEDWLVKHAAEQLSEDLQKVTGRKATVLSAMPSSAGNLIIIGSLNKSAVLRQMNQAGKLKTDSIRDRWEAFQYGVVTTPAPGVAKALVIAGSDRRGTAYGVYDITGQIGVSPWFWWADVPVKKYSEVYLKKGAFKSDKPSVKYRGIFINDEAPAFSGWTKEKFGGVNHKVYAHMFELLLRLKANYLWPAMWGNAFYDDDSLNKQTADQYGIVMGTSHHEPLTRAHDEWRRYGSGKWNYDSNEVKLKQFWRDGVKRAGTTDVIMSIGMRGDGDEPMTRGTATALLERIVKDQRQIISEVTGKDASATPQLWALYKEVQDYYDKGMRVPDDVTLLLCDDNWGNIRKLPSKIDPPHSGGYGIYYHFDYVGGPRNYKWINTNQIERTWEQMQLAYEHGVDRIWIVNVGDLKPMEFPINFFLDYAWKPEALPAEKLPAYYTNWATMQFGQQHAKAIGIIMAQYTKYNSRRKPELLSPTIYNLDNYNEADRVVAEYNQLATEAKAIASKLPPEYKDAYYQLVLHPVIASANVNELYVTVAKNRAYAKSKKSGTNALADRVKLLYAVDASISKYYNDTLAGGKWSHMMDQTHIGYTSWQQPDRNKMPDVSYIEDDKAPLPEITNTQHNTALAGSKSNGVFKEKDGYLSFEAEQYSKAVATAPYKWQVIPNLGRTSSAITISPVTADTVKPSGNSPHLEYRINLQKQAPVKVQAYLSPTLNYHNKGLRYAVSIDNEEPQIVNIHEGAFDRLWNQWVADNIIIKTSQHNVTTAGEHVLKFWMVDPGVVLQKIVVDAGGLKPTYLGPPPTAAR